MNPPISLTITAPLYEQLQSHLFPGDDDEHGAIIAAGISQTARGTRLLARKLFLAEDGLDYVPGKRGYRALTAEFIAHVSDYCATERLCYLAIHCHHSHDTVGFSRDDMASHERGYPALLDITGGGPVGALVFAQDAVAGDIWTSQGRLNLSHLTVLGPRIRTLYPTPRLRPSYTDPIYDRHARLFGDVGQEILGDLKVGIIGLGGGGSLLNEWLARLGVGEIVAVDFDRVDVTNLPRIVGATRLDALALPPKWRPSRAQQLLKQFARHKVYVARRVARRANPRIRYKAVVGNVVDEPTARLLIDADFLFLAGDTMQSRMVFNALVQQYLIPGIQVGVKVKVASGGGIESIHAATRPVLPGPGAGCLSCHKLISPDRLRLEGLAESERRAQRYVDDDDVTEPSVITLNALSAAQAANDFMMMFTGLFRENVALRYHLAFADERQIDIVEPMADPLCINCSDSHRSRWARGDRARLPCRQPS